MTLPLFLMFAIAKCFDKFYPQQVLPREKIHHTKFLGGVKFCRFCIKCKTWFIKTYALNNGANKYLGVFKGFVGGNTPNFNGISMPHTKLIEN